MGVANEPNAHIDNTLIDCDKIYLYEMSTPIGYLTIVANDHLLFMVELSNSVSLHNALSKVKHCVNIVYLQKIEINSHYIIKITYEQLEEYFSSGRKAFKIPLLFEYSNYNLFNNNKKNTKNKQTDQCVNKINNQKIEKIDIVDKNLIDNNSITKNNCYNKTHLHSHVILQAFNITKFQYIVWKRIQNIQFGDMAHYTFIADSINKPTAYRAVANACGKNPVLIIIPCHRVIAKHGSIGGYSAGIEKKIWLLNHEKLS